MQENCIHTMLLLRSGVFGMNIEERHPENIELPGGDVLPLYRFQIDTVIRYRYMTHNERQEEVKNDLYRVSREYRISDSWDFYKKIWYIYCFMFFLKNENV